MQCVQFIQYVANVLTGRIIKSSVLMVNNEVRSTTLVTALALFGIPRHALEHVYLIIHSTFKGYR